MQVKNQIQTTGLITSGRAMGVGEHNEWENEWEVDSILKGKADKEADKRFQEEAKLQVEKLVKQIEVAKAQSGAISKAITSNPKDILGSAKVPLDEIPPVALLHEACAFLDGDIKYGYRNWREKDVRARIYVAAALRHLQAWAEGEEVAPDSGVHHLGHVRACMGILLDAQENGNLIDDRVPGVFSAVSARLSEWVKERIKKG